MKVLFYLIQRFLLRRSFSVATENRYRCQFRFKTSDCVGRTIYKKGDYEPELTKFILGELKFAPGDIFLDIGANIGWYSILLSKKFGSDVQVFAFEPDNLNFSLLSSNLQRNAIQNVTPIKLAVAEETSSKTLYRYKEGNLGRHSLLPTEGLEEQTVDTTTLDHFVKQNDMDPEKVKFIKMDIEGYEYFAMRGAENLLEHVPLVLTEYSPEMLKERGFNPTDLLDFMQRYHYQPHQLLEGSLATIQIRDLVNMEQPVMDVFWVKR